MNHLLSGLLILLTAVSALASSEAVAVSQTLLFVGFRPFVGREANVGEDIANLLDGRVIEAGGTQLAIRTVVMPVEWGLPEPRIRRAVQSIEDEGQTLAGILIIGERDEARVKVDKGARNQRGMDLIDFGHDGSKTPGQRHLGEKMVADDPLGAYYAATLFPAIRDGLTHAGIEFDVGEDAGRYVFGEALYVSGKISPAAGSLHIPGYPVRLDNKEHPENAAHLLNMRDVVVPVIEEIASKTA